MIEEERQQLNLDHQVLEVETELVEVEDLEMIETQENLLVENKLVKQQKLTKKNKNKLRNINKLLVKKIGLKKLKLDLKLINKKIHEVGFLVH